MKTSGEQGNEKEKIKEKGARGKERKRERQRAKENEEKGAPRMLFSTFDTNENVPVNKMFHSALAV